MSQFDNLRALLERANSSCPEGSFGTDAHRYWLNGVHGARIQIVEALPDLLERIAELEGIMRDMLAGRAGARDRARAALQPTEGENP